MYTRAVTHKCNICVRGQSQGSLPSYTHGVYVQWSNRLGSGMCHGISQSAWYLTSYHITLSHHAFTYLHSYVAGCIHMNASCNREYMYDPVAPCIKVYECMVQEGGICMHIRGIALVDRPRKRKRSTTSRYTRRNVARQRCKTSLYEKKCKTRYTRRNVVYWNPNARSSMISARKRSKTSRYIHLHTATHFNTLHHPATYCNQLRSKTSRYINVLQVLCSVLQGVTG